LIEIEKFANKTKEGMTSLEFKLKGIGKVSQNENGNFDSFKDTVVQSASETVKEIVKEQILHSNLIENINLKKTIIQTNEEIAKIKESILGIIPDNIDNKHLKETVDEMKLVASKSELNSKKIKEQFE
jgi:hypothetical protein